MNTIRTLEKDIDLQSDFLKSFKNQKSISTNLQTNTIFSGSGDSLVSAMLAESFSGGIVRAIDPLDLLKTNNWSNQNMSILFQYLETLY